MSIIVEFLSWLDFKFGWIDEDLIQSPHYIQGLQPYKAFEIINSKWKAQLISMLQPNDKARSKYQHIVLGFHDSRFECLAKSFYIEAYDKNFQEVL